MKRLLARAGPDPRRGGRLGSGRRGRGPRGRWRRRLINEALRPPNATADWLHQIEALRAEAAAPGVDPIAEGLAGLVSLTAAGEEEAATVVALLLREALETPGKTAALITPDAALARRVSARLTRWNITADSSAGQPLAASPIGVLAGLLARAAVDPADPVTLLAIVKHPLTRLGLEDDVLGAAGRSGLERCGLRGPRPAAGKRLVARLEAFLLPRPLAGEVAAGPFLPADGGGVAAASTTTRNVEAGVRDAPSVMARAHATSREGAGRRKTPWSWSGARRLFDRPYADGAARRRRLRPGQAMEALAGGPSGGLGRPLGRTGGERAGLFRRPDRRERGPARGHPRRVPRAARTG